MHASPAMLSFVARRYAAVYAHSYARAADARAEQLALLIRDQAADALAVRAPNWTGWDGTPHSLDYGASAPTHDYGSGGIRIPRDYVSAFCAPTPECVAERVAIESATPAGRAELFAPR